MAADSFVHLHLHTEYSLLDGAVRIPDLMEKATRFEMPAVAMTDHGNLFGAIDFYQEARKAGVKPIIGCEVYLAPGSMTERRDIPGRKRSTHLTLLATSARGFANLTKLVSKAHLDGKYYKPRIDKEHLAKWSEDLICLSGCISGEVNEFILNDDLDGARASLESFLDIFGRERLFLELHDHGLEAQRKSTRQLLEFSRHYDLRTVAANDVHFLNRSHHEAHDVMICIGTNANLYDENRMRYSPEVYFKTAEEMRALFKEMPEACDATLDIAERVDIEIELDAASIAKYPQFETPDGSPLPAYFRQLCRQGLIERYGEQRVAVDQALNERLEYEISIMEKMGFLSYFLIVWDFIRWAREQNIPVGPGRGSAAGSLVAYALRITDLCPLRFGLIFERFLNPERVSPPDVDVDFCQTRRGEVIDYVRTKYGERAVSHIITFGTLGAKSVVRDVGRVMGWSYGDGDRIAKMIPTELKMTLSKARSVNPELDAAIKNEPNTAQLWEYATFLEGLTRNTGIHAAGVVISDIDLDEHVALTRGNEGEVVTQYAMGPLTELGMLKMDFLGLKTLTVIQGAVDLIRRHTPEFQLEADGFDDPATFELLQRGETTAVFQLESGGMTAYCRQLGPERIEDIIALLALYRPGPMDLIPSYIDRKKGKEKVKYLHPLLEEVSQETYGILIYQEQVQKAANLLAGYSLGEADLLRRAMGKKKAEEMATQRAMFVEGAARVNNIPEKKANEIFDLLEKFAGYGFNKSHSAAYGLVSYHTAFLKANHPVEFMASVLSNEVNNTDKIAFFVAECRRMGIDILPPDLNRSLLPFAPETDPASGRSLPQIRYGLAAIKNVGSGAMEQVLREREANGPFKSLEDVTSRLDSKAVNKKVLESLIKAGALDFSAERRDSMFQRLDSAMAAAAVEQRDRRSGQGSLFDSMDFVDAAPTPAAQGQTNGGRPLEQWNDDEVLAFEKDLLGFYVSGHPLEPYRPRLEGGKYEALVRLDELDPKKGKTVFAGMIRTLEIKYTRKDSKPFATFVLEDFTGSTEVIAWNDVYAKSTEDLKEGNVIAIRARIEIDSRTESRRLTADAIKPVKKPRSAGSPLTGSSGLTAATAVAVDDSRAADPDAATNGNGRSAAPPAPFELTIEAAAVNADALGELRQLVLRHRGRSPLHLLIRRPDGEVVRLLTDREFNVHPGAELDAVLDHWRQQHLTRGGVRTDAVPA